MATVKDLVAEVAAEKVQAVAIETAITGLVAQVEANKSDPVALDQAIADMKANIAGIVAAVPQNTDGTNPAPQQ